MNQKSLRVLEFNKIIELLKSKASSSLGLKYIEELVPSSDFEEVKYMQQETSETQAGIAFHNQFAPAGIISPFGIFE